MNLRDCLLDPLSRQGLLKIMRVMQDREETISERNVGVSLSNGADL